MSKDQKTKSIYNIVIERCNVSIRLFYNINTNHIGIITSFRSNEEKQKEYRESHRNLMNRYNKQYYEDNKEKIKNQTKEYKKYHHRISFLEKKVLTNLPLLKSGYVYHHLIYDHLNKDKYVMMMLRNKHTKLHHQMKRDGIEIQHINVRVNDFKGF